MGECLCQLFQLTDNNCWWYHCKKQNKKKKLFNNSVAVKIKAKKKEWEKICSNKVKYWQKANI